jgi:hypothetical protein
LNLLKTTPTAHNEQVIGSNAGDDVNTLGLEFIVLLNIRREVIDMAGRLQIIIERVRSFGQ